MPKIRIRFTRLGLHFVFVAVFAMAGGAVRGFNLLLVLAGVLVAVLLVQWRCSRRMMEILSVTRKLPNAVFTGQTFAVEYVVRNHHPWTPAWMIRIDDSIQRPGVKNRLRLNRTSPSETPEATLSCGVGHVAAKTIAPATAECEINRRGRYVIGGTKLSSTFPFALLCGAQTQDDPTFVDVFPRLLTVHRNWQHYLSPREPSGGATARRRGLDEGEFYGLRPWQRGDSPRQIHWRTTARIGDLAVRQTEESRHLHAHFLVDGYIASPKRSQQETLETTISLAATLAVELSAHASETFSMVVAGEHLAATDYRLPQSTTSQALHLLSSMIGTDQVDLAGAIRLSSSISDNRRSVVILSTRSLLDALGAVAKVNAAAGQALESQLAEWQRRSHLKWIDVSDPNSSTWFKTKTAEMSRRTGNEPGSGMATRPARRALSSSESGRLGDDRASQSILANSSEQVAL